jgi:curved DNA-binding protein
MEYKDYYKTLGVSKSATSSEIKQAYRRLAKKYHPDVHKEDKKAQMSEKFREVNEAYEVLSDPKKKQMYDNLGSDWQNKAQHQNPFQGQGQKQGYSRTYTSSGNFGDFSDFFNSIFGSMGGGFSQGNFGGQSYSFKSGGSPFGEFQNQTQPRTRFEPQLQLTLEEAFAGGKRKLIIPVPSACSACGATGITGNSYCQKCHGSGEVTSKKTVTVNFPKGIRDGGSVRLKNLSSSQGDMFLKINISPHPQFKLMGSDIEVTLIVMPWTAAIGGFATVPSLDSPVKIKIPPKTHTGKRLRIPNKGYFKPDGTRGDLYAKVQIDIPQTLTQEQTDLLSKLNG